MRDICRQDCDSEAVGGRSRGFSAQFRPLITQALIHTSSHWTELQKSLHGCISSQNYMVTGVYILSNISVPASDYPSSDTHKLSLELQKRNLQGCIFLLNDEIICLQGQTSSKFPDPYSCMGFAHQAMTIQTFAHSISIITHSLMFLHLVIYICAYFC